MPTAARIARRAGCSVRSVFERFPDLSKLRIAAADYGLAQAAALAPIRNVDADRETRIRSQVETRAGTCERGVALWRVLVNGAGEDPELREKARLGRERTLERIELMYRPELDSLAQPQRLQLVIALESLTDYESWWRLRNVHGLSYEQACALWRRLIDRMLPPTPGDNVS